MKKSPLRGILIMNDRHGIGAVNMETKKWEALLTAVELGSFTRAAERLG